MANRRLLVKRLKAVRNIRKITRTMELIATSRFKKAMDRAAEAAEYTRKISEIVGDLGRANLKFSHPLLEKRAEEKKSILLVLTSNRISRRSKRKTLNECLRLMIPGFDQSTSRLVPMVIFTWLTCTNNVSTTAATMPVELIRRPGESTN